MHKRRKKDDWTSTLEAGGMHKRRKKDDWTSTLEAGECIKEGKRMIGLQRLKRGNA